MGEVIREVESPVERSGDGHVVRVYAARAGGSWEAWLEFTSIRHGDLRRSWVAMTAPTRDEVVRWASGLDDAALGRALEDAEIHAPTELGAPPR